MRRLLGLSLVILVLVAPFLGDASGDFRVLGPTMRGADVYSLQEKLVDLGYELALDGVYGVQTEAVVREVQAVLGLKADGFVGHRTLAALNETHRSIISHTVQAGENLSQLAKRYETTVANIANCNGMANPDRVLAGQVIQIPPLNLAVAAGPRNFIWPVQGKISSGYGYRLHPLSKVRHFHGGIDIAAPEGTPVRAAAAGRVAKAGSMGNYGLGLVLDHGAGYSTWYGHNSKILVRPGEAVQQGQIVAMSGKTGLVTGPHLDFRIKIGDQTIDPLERLP
ncbi:MAG: peptidoglycan DD-metalloendopeptidase family protein [Firmicutes bacterium]|nr:peptidoglycan DD-metalloendopeptidase family protein [Bacillota bacterium]